MFEEFDDFKPAQLDELKDAAGTHVNNNGNQNTQNQNQNGGQNNGYNNNNNQGGGYNSGGNNNGYNRGNGGGGGYNNNRGGNGGGGYNRGGGGGGGRGFQPKPDVVEAPYIPVTMFIDRDFPEDVKELMYKLASRLIDAGVTVRYNADDLALHQKFSTLSPTLAEAYIPWKGFNNVDTKHYFNMETAKHIAQSNFSAWDKIPDAVKSMLARNVRMIFGDKNNSVSMCVITWSPDGASKSVEVTKDTGKASFIINVASKFHFPVINVAKPQSINMLERNFELT